MISLENLTDKLQNGLNANTQGFTFKLHADSGRFEKAVRQMYSNDFIEYVNGLVSLTSSEIIPNQNGMLVSTYSVRCDIVVRCDDTEEPVYQPTVDNPTGELVEQGNIAKLISLRQVLDNFLQNSGTFQINDDLGGTFTVSVAYSFTNTGTRAQRPQLGDSMTYTFFAYYNVIQNGENSNSYVFELDGLKIPYRSVTIGRRPITEADVYEGTAQGVAKSTSTASQFFVSFEVPAFKGAYNTIVKNYILNGESNAVHFLRANLDEVPKNFLVMFGETSASAVGVLNVGGTVSFVEAVDDFEMLNFASNLYVYQTVAEYSTPGAANEIRIPGLSDTPTSRTIHFLKEDNIFIIDEKLMYTENATTVQDLVIGSIIVSANQITSIT